MPSCGKKNFHGGQVSTFYAKNQAGAGKSGFPGNFEVFALQAVRRPIRKIGQLWFYITHYSFDSLAFFRLFFNQNENP
jgi:hypothetical protein